jgi:hypothetical protein
MVFGIASLSSVESSAADADIDVEGEVVWELGRAVVTGVRCGEVKWARRRTIWITDNVRNKENTEEIKEKLTGVVKK